jgi:hypothetical protein
VTRWEGWRDVRGTYHANGPDRRVDAVDLVDDGVEIGKVI